jgi:hypothetical protein
LMLKNRHTCQGRNVRMNSVKRVGWVAYTLVLISPTVPLSFPLFHPPACCALIPV